MCRRRARPSKPRRRSSTICSTAALEPAVTKVVGEDRRVPFSEVERRRSLPGVAEATDSFELLRAVVADERAEDAHPGRPHPF